MDKEKMKSLGTEIGHVQPEEPKGPGRPVGAPVEFVSPKNKDRKWLEKEIWKHRKELRDLRDKVHHYQVAESALGSPSDIQLPVELWGIIPSLGYDYLAERFGEYWRLSQKEMQAYGMVTEKLASKYLGQFMAANPEMTAFCAVVVATTLPRALMMVKKEKEENARRGTSNDGTRTEGNGENDVGKKRVVLAS